jgi:hypothetical protein
MVMSPNERTLRASLAAHSQHAQGKTNTGPAFAARMAKYERDVDPDGTLNPAERARRAKHAMAADMKRLALRSAQARRRQVKS